jgi:hypothetical protein
MNLAPAQPGRCRYCRCTDRCACPEGCSWYDDQATVCDSPLCVARFRLALANAISKLLRIGLKKQQGQRLSCYSMAAVIIDELRKELAMEVRDAKVAS